MLGLAVELRVGRLESLHLLALFDRRTVIDEGPDRNPLRQLLQSADVIDVVVRRDQVVDLRDAGVGDRQHEPIGVASAGVAGVNERRLPGGRDEQRRLPPFGVDDVDLQRLGAPAARAAPTDKHSDQRDRQRERLHGPLHFVTGTKRATMPGVDCESTWPGSWSVT